MDVPESVLVVPDALAILIGCLLTLAVALLVTVVVQRQRLAQRFAGLAADIALTEDATGLGTWSRGIDDAVARWSPSMYRLFGVDPATFTPTREAMLKAAGIGSVVKAVSAIGALNILADKQKRFNCIICNYGMDVKDGLALLKEIRAGKHPYIQRDQCFIMLTADGQEAVVRAAPELDVNAYARKPVTNDSLSKAIHRAFNRAPTLKGPEVYAAVAMRPPA